MRLNTRLLIAASALSIMAAPAATALANQAVPAAPAQAEPAPLEDLIAGVDIPYQMFTLENGLTVLVHEDRKTPVVAVSVWYGVGSKHEPRGKTGFAHLFEHLMFNGSENAPGDFFEPLQQVGATDFNGTTWFDRTNYFQTVPTGALDTALFLESDRMGHLLGAVTQENLDNQIGVVQNEKRQGDNQPFGMVEYEQLETLYPSGHPYHHSTIGSMDDLSGATLDDVKSWFTGHYGPNNAVLVLAGDIDVETAKQKVNRWFGSIPAGPEIEPVEAPVPTLDEPVSKVIYDQVSTPRVYRLWAIPGLNDQDAVPLEMAARVLGGLASSRLDNQLVRGKQLAVSAVAQASTFAQAGQFEVYADLKPGVELADLEAALDAELADLIANGPTEDELQRAATQYAAAEIRGLDNLGGFDGKAPTLAQGLLYADDPEFYKKRLARIASVTPEEVQNAAIRWLDRPVFRLTVMPGKRQEGGENRGGYVTGKAPPMRTPEYFWQPGSMTGPVVAAPKAEPDRSSLPAMGDLQPLEFPDIQRAVLNNGMEIYLAQREGVPMITAQISFDAGHAADPKDALGTQSLMLEAMDAGTTTLDATELAIAQERLGASISGSANRDNTVFTLSALEPNLAQSFALLADYVRNPAFDTSELERVRSQQLNRINAENTQPLAVAQKVLMPAIYGPAHPYGVPPSGLGEASVVTELTAQDLREFHSTWLRPDQARLYVVGDVTMEQVTSLARQAFGNWTRPSAPAPEKNFDVALPAPQPRVILVDRPASPQSMIFAGKVIDKKGTDDLVALDAANSVLGGSFLSRLNSDLRETKGWSYGVRSMLVSPEEQVAFAVYAPVQADRTGDSIAALREQMDGFLTASGVSEDELVRTVNGEVRGLPGTFETSGGVLAGLVNIVELDRPDNYYEMLPAKYEALTPAMLDQVAREQNLDDGLVWVVVGDAATVRPQLDQLGLTVETATVGEAAE
ncbi:M16 family metallopeptidase [Croceicoccus marinus]|jgi:predicted Zn-dependent peptidase|uniref:Insulinase family protein n=1 Tax=Croceicoccus marinus TaxID=450378 RepID=A0A7G6VT40_9SPHN|nr:pitrilysin family protein [Croceicoccus marinus]QNE04905.1 insulinase family protein [Croceicoccus marinus]